MHSEEGLGDSLDSAVGSSLSLIAEQANKLRLGKLRTLVALYEGFSFVHIAGSGNLVAT